MLLHKSTANLIVQFIQQILLDYMLYRSTQCRKNYYDIFTNLFHDRIKQTIDLSVGMNSLTIISYGMFFSFLFCLMLFPS